MHGIRQCPACAGRRSRPLGRVSGFGIHRCFACASLFTDRVPHDTEQQDYDAYYDEGNLSVPSFVDHRLLEIVAEVGGGASSGRWLDVGFGAGALLDAVSRSGWEAHGTEVSSEPVSRARARGHRVTLGDVSAAGYPEAHFDVVSLVEVLEHVPDPDELLRQVRPLVHPTGTLYVTTPNGAGMSARLLRTSWSVVSPPEHLQLLSPAGLRRLVERHGFRARRIDAHGVNPYELAGALRRRSGAAVSPTDRVQTSYQLNAALLGRAPGRAAKAGLNWLLSRTRAGDALKLHGVPVPAPPGGSSLPREERGAG